MTKEYSKNLVSVWDLDELIFLKADAFDSIGTPIKFSSSSAGRPSFNATNANKKLFQRSMGSEDGNTSIEDNNNLSRTQKENSSQRKDGHASTPSCGVRSHTFPWG